MNRSLSEWVDCIVRASDGDVGKIEQFFFDDLTWLIRYMAVKTGGRCLIRKVLISQTALGKPDWKKRVFPANLTMAQVRSSPRIDIGAPVSRQYEMDLHVYYAWPFYWGGGFYVPAGYGVPMLPARYAEAAEANPSSGVRKVDSHLRSTREVTDCRVHAIDGNIGHVEDFIFDDESWAIRYLVVNTRDWLPDGKVLVLPQSIKSVNWADKEVFVDLSQAAIKKSPKFDPFKPVDSEYDGKLVGHLKKPVATEWVVFKFRAPPGADVHVAGTFNNWDTTAIKLGAHSKGMYTATVLLPLGRYEYKFIVNGDWRNGADGNEQVPNAYGTTNNVLVVSRATGHSVHLHTFSRLPGGASLLWNTPMDG